MKRVNGNGADESDVRAAIVQILESCRLAGPVSARGWGAGTAVSDAGESGGRGWDGRFVAAVGMALRQALEDVRWAEGDPEALLRLSWIVLRAGAEPVQVERAWAVAVADDLGTLPERLQRKWWALLDANDHAAGRDGELGKSVEKLLAGLPAEEFERRFDAWTRLLADAETPDLRYGGVTLLHWLLRLAAGQREARLDASLYRIAQSNWGPLAVSWVRVYLRVLGTRPRESAAACIEALSLHPATERLPEVEELRAAALAGR